MSEDELRGIFSRPLPGEDAQYIMAPGGRKAEAQKSLEKAEPRLSAVLVLFFSMKNEWYIPLIRRPSYEGVHSGQISFPGGRKEDFDQNLEDTAFREAQEEVGLKRSETELLGELSSLYIPPSNFKVFPFAAMSQNKPGFVADEREVEEILFLKLKDLLNDHDPPFTELVSSSGRKINTPYFELSGNVIWGATAMILSELRHLFLQNRSSDDET